MSPYSSSQAKGLLKSAVRDNNPVVMLENELLYGTSFPMSDEVLRDDYCLPLDKGVIERSGTDITICTFSRMVGLSLDAADVLQAEHGISAEVIDCNLIVTTNVDSRCDV